MLICFSRFVALEIKPPAYIQNLYILDQAVFLIEELLKNGQAYWYKEMYFDPLNIQRFWQTFHIDMSRYPHLKNVFINTYPGTIGTGRFYPLAWFQKGDTFSGILPSEEEDLHWNVQDPAMVTQTLGFSISILPRGGIDNLVRHHDYVIALTESVSGKQFELLLHVLISLWMEKKCQK